MNIHKKKKISITSILVITLLSQSFFTTLVLKWDTIISWNLRRTAHIQFQEVSHDFGKVLTGQTLKHIFYFKNASSSFVKIASIKKSCGCIVESYSHSNIPPGAVGTIELALRLPIDAFPSQIIRTAAIEFTSDDLSCRENFDLKLIASMKPLAQIQVEYVNQSKDFWNFKVTILREYLDPSDFEKLSFKSANENFAIKLNRRTSDAIFCSVGVSVSPQRPGDLLTLLCKIPQPWSTIINKNNGMFEISTRLPVPSSSTHIIPPTFTFSESVLEHKFFLISNEPIKLKRILSLNNHFDIVNDLTHGFLKLHILTIKVKGNNFQKSIKDNCIIFYQEGLNEKKIVLPLIINSN